MKKQQLDMFIADKHTKLVDAMQKIDDNANSILFVTDEKNCLCGSVSDGDIRRWLLKGGIIDVEINRVMNPNPKYIYYEKKGHSYDYMKRLFIRALPIVDRQMHIRDIILEKEREESKKESGLKGVSVVIMAGGKGTRLYPFTKILPKPLIPIRDIPIVERVIDSFHQYGVTDFIMTVNYKKNMIKSYFADIEKEYNIEYVEEPKPLGTGGSIRLITRNFDRALFVVNCDSLIRTDYETLYKYHQESDDAITVVTAMKNDIIPYGVIYSKKNGEIERMVEKPKRSYLINTGMYLINPEIIELIPDDTPYHMTQLVEKAMNLGYKVGMYPVSEDSFLDMGEFAEMKRMEEKLNLE